MSWTVGLGIGAGRRQALVTRELRARLNDLWLGVGSVEAVLELLGPDVVWHVPGSGPRAGAHRGLEAVGEYLGERSTLTLGLGESWRREAEAAPSRGRRDTWSHPDGLWGGELYRFQAGRIVEVWLGEGPPCWAEGGAAARRTEGARAGQGRDKADGARSRASEATREKAVNTLDSPGGNGP